MLKDFKAVPPLVTDINLSLDDKFLYVSCWGTGEFLQYDVSDPFNPKKTGSVRIGGIVNRTPHPKKPDQPLAGGPQMVEVSRDGKRIYFTNSLYAAWDEQFYPDGVGSWMVKLERRSEWRHRVRQKLFRREQRLPGSSSSPRRRRFLERFLLFSVSELWPWLAVFGLGMFHGINPAMGWLFAVALGLQEQKRAAVFRALPPMVLGHAVSIGIIIAVVLVAAF